MKSDRVETYLTNTLTKEMKIVQDRLAGKILVDFRLHYTKSFPIDDNVVVCFIYFYVVVIIFF